MRLGYVVLFRYLSCLLCKIWIRMEIRPSKDSSEIPRIGVPPIWASGGDREGMREKEGERDLWMATSWKRLLIPNLASQMFGYPYSFISNLPSAEKDRVLEMVERTEISPLLPEDQFPTLSHCLAMF